LAVIEVTACKKEISLNTANLRRGLLMPVAAISHTLTAKGVVTHQEMSAAATLFPIRVLLLANEAAQRARSSLSQTTQNWW
jgi:cysteine sulfinate desulfinase/cysteine desulfurase-like protein